MYLLCMGGSTCTLECVSGSEDKLKQLGLFTMRVLGIDFKSQGLVASTLTC